MRPINTFEMKQHTANNWKAIVAILGARMHYAVPTVLAKHGRLDCFYTDWYLPESGSAGLIGDLLLHSPIKALRRAAMRSSILLPDQLVRPFPLLGLSYALTLRMCINEAWRERAYVYFGRTLAALARKAGYGEAAVVYGMNTASLELFISAKKMGLKCILEQCSAPYEVMNKLYQEEYSLWPAWERSQSKHFTDRLAHREMQEWELADAILAGSSFVVENLVRSSVPAWKCALVPYAVDVTEYQSRAEVLAQSTSDHMNVLFLGGVGVRKGIQYLYKALRMLKNSRIKTRAAGNVLVKPEIARQLSEHMELLGLMPRSEVQYLLRCADVLVLPSICEGSALVTYEALASGVPVITTPNAGSVVQDGVTGFVVPNRDAEALAERLEQLAQNPDLRQEMSFQARRFAEENLSWEAYSHRLLAALEGAIEKKSNELVI